MLYNMFYCYLYSNDYPHLCTNSLNLSNLHTKMPRNLKPILITVALAAFFILSAVTVRAGVPGIRNFSRTVYGGGAQNWAVAQDSIGRMYFGNRLGLLTYDSNEWQMLFLPNFSTVRSILIDAPKGRIYVGGSEEFGYFDTSNPFVSPRYVSLVGTIDTPGIPFAEIWNIYRDKDNIWFQGDFKIMRWDGRKSTVISVDDKVTTSTLYNGQVYLGMLHRGLCRIEGRRAVDVPGAEALRGKRIVSLIATPKGKLVVTTAFDGVWVFEGRTLTPFNAEIDSYLRDNQAFSATYSARARQLAFGTVSGGAVVFDETSPDEPIYINVSNGMQDNTVLNLGFDRDLNLWLALDDGIDFAVTNSAISRLSVNDNSTGAGYASLLDGTRMLLGTNRGLYIVPWPVTGGVGDAPVIKGQIWALDTYDGDIFVCGDAGLWTASRGGGFTRVEDVGGVWSVQPVPGHPGMVIASGYEGFIILKKSAAGVWTLSHRVTGYSDSGGRFVTENDGTVWIAHWMKGIYRMKLSSDLSHFEDVTLLTSSNGLPANRNNLVSKINGQPIFSTEGGFYLYDARNNRFVRDKRYNALFSSRRSSHLYEDTNGTVWSVSPDFVWMGRFDSSGHPMTDTVTYQPLTQHIIPGFDHFEFVSSEKAIMANQEGFFEVDLSGNRHAAHEPDLFVTRVRAAGDSLVYSSPASRADIGRKELSVSYDLNSLRFDVAMPEFRAPKAVKYSFMLDGYDDDWSPWSDVASKEYTQLGEGDYVLKVRARDSYSGRLVETLFPFTVRPPWYRSIWSKLVYIIIFIALIWFLLNLIRQNAERQTRRVAEKKEAELARMRREAKEQAIRKDYEIAHLKSEQLEHDIKHKSEELSNITMNVIRKNEMLLDIASRLDKLRETLAPASESAPEARQLAHIQRLIQDNISHDDDWKSFTQNFDVVYEDYTKRLMDRHPDLSQSDLRVCCYLKMGLSSKEIAPLFNISYRSVEMTRYRLRKKLGLSREINLVEYLQKI